MTDRDQEYLRMAMRLASQSSDPSTQNGAVIMVGGSCRGTGFNDLPDRVFNERERWDRPAKYSYIEHAERAAIYHAAARGRMTMGATMYCPWFACADCARAIIAAGIIRVVGLPLPESHWSESIRIGDEMLTEAGVEIVREAIPPAGIQLRRGGEVVTY